MVGRGALIQPWIFKDCANGQSWCPDAEERVEVYRTLTAYMKEHFGDDSKGKKKAFYFLPWHFKFFCRARPLREEWVRELSERYPLMQASRQLDAALAAAEGPLSPLERLLRVQNDDAHLEIAEALWETGGSGAAATAVALRRLAEARVDEFEALARAGGAGDRDGAGGRSGGRSGDRGGGKSGGNRRDWDSGGEAGEDGAAMGWG
ncbi:unnamed protein product [Phaeothamnion confervicola]